MIERGSEKIAWFENAKLGLFIHWGLYSATEGYYNGKETKGIVEWIQSREKIPNAAYERFAEKLSTKHFDAEQIAALAEEMGARYLVFTTKHHEGFSMFNTAYDDYSINGRSGAKEDVFGALCTAARAHGIRPCAYYSQSVDFHEPNAMGNTWDFAVPENERDFESYFEGKCKFQLRELLTQYGDIGVVWFDVPWGITAERAKELRSFVKSLQPDCLINGRLGGATEDSDFLCMGDNEAPYGKTQVCAETCATTNDSWGYKRDDKNFKTPRTVIELLCAVVSKGANLLLNIGPKPDGSLPCEAVDLAKSLGSWMKRYGEAIYSAKASPFTADFSFGWVTQKENALYLLVKEPQRMITLYGLQNKVLAATVLGGENVCFTQSARKITLQTGGVAWDDTVTVIQLTLDAEPRVQGGLFQQEEGAVILPCCACRIQKESKTETPTFASSMDRVLGEYWGNLSTEMKVNINGSVEWWKSEKDSIYWDFTPIVSGDYEVLVYTATAKYMPWTGRHRVRVCCGDNDLCAELTEDVLPHGVNRKYFSETGSIIGKIHLQANKNCRLHLFAESINLADPAGLYVTQIMLIKN